MKEQQGTEPKRLQAELAIARERLFATREILEVISQSREDEKPVFEAILRNAAQLCEVPDAALMLVDHTNKTFHMAAHWGELRVAVDLSREWSMDAPLPVAQSLREARTVHVENMTESAPYLDADPTYRRMVDVDGLRTRLCVPLVLHGSAFGAIVLSRLKVQPFDDDEIALIEGFAAQAVIAIENARQFREVKNRLERERASAEILEVINQSRDDERPVFKRILERAAKLCDAPTAGLQLVNEDRTRFRYVCKWGEDRSSMEYGESWPLGDSPLMVPTAIREARVVHNPDISDDPIYKDGDPTRVRLVEQEGIRTYLVVPLVREKVAIGSITLIRREVRPFSEDEISLVETFAAQAVIAIENVRQFREVQTRLEREAATRAILEAISRSRDNEMPVFETILRHVERLCASPITTLVLMNEAETHWTFAALRGENLSEIEVGHTWEINKDGDLYRSVAERRVIENDDLAQSEHYKADDPDAVQLVDVGGLRTRVLVPLISGGKGIGVLNLFRREVAPFAPDIIALVESFAAQAVIAIENVRQFREVQTRLEREAATREVLQVISQSREDDAPVFDAILSRAQKLCNAPMSGLVLARPGDASQRLVANRGVGEPDLLAKYQALSIPMDPEESLVARAIIEGKIIEVPDITQTDVYRDGQPGARFMGELGIRTILLVPIQGPDEAIGVISLFRREVMPFQPDQIALVESFAAQAVIAIENVRQFREVQERYAREKASVEVLAAISTNRDDETPVFHTILERVSILCQSDYAGLAIVNEARTHLVYTASHGPALAHSQYGDMKWALGGSSSFAEAVKQGVPVQIDDLRDTDLYRSGDPQRVAHADKDGIRTFLAVPMFQHGEVIGAFGLAKFEVAPFDADDIALVETFAAQAAIAIENVRQFKEVQTRLEREVASREILDVISRSQDDEAPVFDTVLRRAATLCGAPMASLNIVEEDRRHGRLVAHWGEDLRLIEVGKTLWQLDVDLGEEDYTETSMRDGVVMQCHDLKDTDRYRSGHARRREMVDVEGIRTFLAVPLIRRGQAIGNIALYRREVQPFTDDQIALVETFAAQAVIAIENVRQFEEVQTRLEREAATREILQVISQSPDDEHPVFHAILKNASRLCDAPLAFLPMANEQRTHVSVPAFRGVPDSFAAALNEFNEPMEGSGLVAVRAVAEARVIRSADLFNDPEFPASGRWRTELVEREGARSVLVVPLLRDGVAVGAIMLYRREIRPFSDDEVELIRGFAAQAVIAVENVRQFRALEVLNAELGDRVEEQVSEIERMGRLKRFLPAAVADTVVSSGSDSMLSSHRALLGVLFCDIRGFTAFCETAEPEETIEVLQTYHEEMGKLINAHGAGVDHRMGDGIMVLFNDPLPCDDPAGDAVRLGMAMQSRMSDLCTAWKRMGYRLGFGVGVSLGYATVGMVGFEGRFDYTASGTAINLASRLCDEAEDGEILLSPRAAIAVEDAFRVESRGELTLKGLREPLEVFRLTGTDAT